LSNNHLAYNKSIVMLIPTGIWKIAIPLEGRSLSTSDISAYYIKSQTEQSITIEELYELLQNSMELEIQIPHHFEHLDIPVVPVVTANSSYSQTGIEVSFQITEKSSTYDDFLNELMIP